MVAILDIPEVRARVSRVSVAEYHRIGESGERRRTELIRGIVIEKISKSPLHSSISTRLNKLVLRLAPDGYIVRKEEPLTLLDSEPEPDIAVVAAREGEEFATEHPHTAELVIEVAVTSAALDRANASLYAEAGVQEYWIVLGASRAIEVYRRPEHGIYQEVFTCRSGDELACASVPPIRLRVAECFA